jgi:hypothetical protein
MRASWSLPRAWRPLALFALGATVLVGLSAPMVPDGTADAAGARYDVSNWTDPQGTSHRIRWNPCQAAVTFAVNPRLAGDTAASRAAAIKDVKAAFHRVSMRTGITFEYEGKTTEIPSSSKKQSWADRQRAAEVVVAWVDQSRAKYRTDLMADTGSGYGSGVGGWMMRAWTDSGGSWHAAIGRGFVVLNSAHNGLYERGFGAGTTRGALLLHEVGHAMGLGHAGSTREIMYPTMLDRSSSAYKSGDRTGLKKVGSSLGCIAGASGAWPQI